MPHDSIILDWQDVNHESGRWSDRWNDTLALYAILHPDDDEILYLGKADGYTSTVARRWNAPDKHDRVWRRLEDERGIYEHGLVVGEFVQLHGQRLTRELVIDAESLLIQQIRPWANRQNIKSRGYSRPGMTVLCQGAWPLSQKMFRDD